MHAVVIYLLSILEILCSTFPENTWIVAHQMENERKKFLTQSAVYEMIDETTSIFDRTFSMLTAGIREKLATAGVDLSGLNLDSVFEEFMTDTFAINAHKVFYVCCDTI